MGALFAAPDLRLAWFMRVQSNGKSNVHGNGKHHRYQIFELGSSARKCHFFYFFIVSAPADEPRRGTIELHQQSWTWQRFFFASSCLLLLCWAAAINGSMAGNCSKQKITAHFINKLKAIQREKRERIGFNCSASFRTFVNEWNNNLRVSVRHVNAKARERATSETQKLEQFLCIIEDESAASNSKKRFEFRHIENFDIAPHWSSGSFLSPFNNAIRISSQFSPHHDLRSGKSFFRGVLYFMHFHDCLASLEYRKTFFFSSLGWLMSLHSDCTTTFSHRLLRIKDCIVIAVNESTSFRCLFFLSRRRWYNSGQS